MMADHMCSNSCLVENRLSNFLRWEFPVEGWAPALIPNIRLRRLT